MIIGSFIVGALFGACSLMVIACLAASDKHDDDWFDDLEDFDYKERR